MSVVIVCIAELLPSDRDGPPIGEDRPDFPLIIANERAVPSLAKRLSRLKMPCKVIRKPNLSLEDVRNEINATEGAIVTVYGHGVAAPSPPAIYSRRKRPSAVLADETTVSRRCRCVILPACHSTRLCESTPRTKRCDFIGFFAKAMVPVSARLSGFSEPFRELVLRAYEDAFVTPIVLTAELGNPELAVEKAKELLRETLERCKEQFHEHPIDYRAHVLAQITAIFDNHERLSYL